MLFLFCTYLLCESTTPTFSVQHKTYSNNKLRVLLKSLFSSKSLNTFIEKMQEYRRSIALENIGKNGNATFGGFPNRSRNQNQYNSYQRQPVQQPQRNSHHFGDTNASPSSSDLLMCHSLNASSGSLSSSVSLSDRSASTDCVEEFIADVPFAGNDFVSHPAGNLRFLLFLIVATSHSSYSMSCSGSLDTSHAFHIIVWIVSIPSKFRQNEKRKRKKKHVEIAFHGILRLATSTRIEHKSSKIVVVDRFDSHSNTHCFVSFICHVCASVKTD